MKQVDENFVGYLLNSLDADGQRQVEAYLADHPEEQHKLDLLRRGLEPLDADREEVPPAADLVYRTLGRVAEFCTRELPRAPLPSRVQLSYRPPWRRVEVVVAASILLVAVGMGVSALSRLRDSSPLVECKDNLRVLYAALSAYHQQHKHFPDVKEEEPHNAAGMVVPMLVHAGVLDPAAVNVRCPGNGAAKPCPVTYEEAKALGPDEFRKLAPKLISCYAYSLGHYEGDVYHAPEFRDGFNARMPLMSDRPPYDMQMGNSPNHGGSGQNVLFQDGHVDFLKVRAVPLDDDIFLNRDKKVGAGCDINDASLGHSAAKP